MIFEKIKKMAEESFKNHILITKHYSEKFKLWHCGEPGTYIFHFNVVSVPDCLVIYGDIGSNMLRVNSEEPEKWAISANKSVDYVIEKIINKKEIFIRKKAEQYLQDLIEETDVDELEAIKKQVQIVKDNWEYEYENEIEFVKALYEANFQDVGEIIRSIMDYTDDVYWTVACIQKFVELLKLDK